VLTLPKIGLDASPFCLITQSTPCSISTPVPVFDVFDRPITDWDAVMKWLFDKIVGGAALRRDHEAFTGALRRRGAAPRLLRALLAGEVLGAAVAGLVTGCLLGAAGAGVVAARGGLPVLGTAGDAVLAALPGAAVLTLVAGLLLAVTVALPAARDGAAARAVWHAVAQRHVQRDLRAGLAAVRKLGV